MSDKKTAPAPLQTKPPLIQELHLLIDSARQQVIQTVTAQKHAPYSPAIIP